MRPKHVPIRTCAACHARGPKEHFVRIVRTPAGDIRVEPPRNVPGRGSYLCRKVGCWVEGIERGRLAHALRGGLPPEASAVLMARARAEFGGE